MIDEVYVTGSSGLVGAELVKNFAITPPSELRPDLLFDEGWRSALAGKQAVVHCAALSSSRGYSDEFVAQVNVGGTLRVARLARQAGVKRFVFLSSVKVFGEFTNADECFHDEKSERKPTSVYGESKARAEDALMNFHEPGVFEVIVLRPAVVIAPAAKGAIGTLKKLAGRRVPFPVLIEGNARDFVSIDNLVSSILRALEHPAAGGGAFSVTDGSAISTRALFEAMALAQGRRPRLLKVPSGPSRWLFSKAGRELLWHRLLGNMQVDGSLIRQKLSWNDDLKTLAYVAKAYRS
jgi:nucleoside-diphosphate-sugar epimerase